MDIRDNLRRYIVDKRLTQAILAKRVGMTPAKLNAALMKRRKLEAGEFISLCGVLGVSMEDMRDYGEKHRPPRSEGP